jgi:sensor domain CHASE-containing protein
MASAPASLFSPFSETIGKFLYDPITSWQHFFNPQFIFNYNPQDEGVETHVLDQVGSYGSQLSTLIDAIEALRAQFERIGHWDAEASASFAEFETLRQKAAQAVADYRKATPDDIVAAVQTLKKSDSAGFADLRAKLDPLW